MSVCITTVVDQKYSAYIPMFAWCCKTVYPSYHIRIFVVGEYKERIKNADIIPLFNDFPTTPYNAIALRFVVPPEYYREFDYVYITDIDIMIMPERVELADFHKAEMVASGLPYSNSTRNVHHYLGNKSLTGLHFATRKWFEQTENERQRYYSLLQKGLVGNYREYDGVMLHRMCERSELKLPNKYNLKKRHHGIHLGNFRLFEDKAKWAERIIPDYRSQWMEWVSNPTFKTIVDSAREKNPELNKQIGLLLEFIKNPK